MHPGQKLKPGARVCSSATACASTAKSWRCISRDGGRFGCGRDHPAGSPTRSIASATFRCRRTSSATMPRIGQERYQTIYARERGSVAAPTAGLHFTAGAARRAAAQGVERVEVTLHVGYGTFKPVKADRVEDHVVDAERFTVSAETAAALTRAKREGRRIIAVGTTTVRTLESLTMTTDGEVMPAPARRRCSSIPVIAFSSSTE